MGAVMKLLLTIVTQRLNSISEENGLFSRSQAGFRRMEEAPLQVACLLEIATRREKLGLPTYVCGICRLA